MALTVPCAHCRGSGARDLTEIEETTLGAVTSEWTTTADLRMRLRARGVELTVNAVVMRLQALHLFGLVDRKLATRGHYAWKLVTQWIPDPVQEPTKIIRHIGGDAKRLPNCAVVGCDNKADPRCYAPDEDGNLMWICDGHDPVPHPTKIVRRIDVDLGGEG